MLIADMRFFNAAQAFGNDHHSRQLRNLGACNLDRIVGKQIGALQNDARYSNGTEHAHSEQGRVFDSAYDVHDSVFQNSGVNKIKPCL
jgi:hypothetical protein